MNITEKILARASEKNTVSPDDIVFAKVDKVMVHDVSGPGVLKVFDKTNQYESSSAMSMSERAEASKVFPKELLGDWQTREKALLIEIEQLNVYLVKQI